MADINFSAGKEGLDFLSAVEAMIKRSCIIDFGIVQKVVAKGIVEVSLAVARTKQDMTIMTCVLANIASASFTLDITPNVGDRVIVLYPRAYDEKMFTVPDSDTDKTNILVNENVKGYNLTTGIAILMNQYKTATHKNLIKIENGAVSVSLGYDKENDVNHLTVTAGADGAVSVKNGATEIALGADGSVSANVGYDEEAEKYNSTLSVGADGYLSYEHNKDGKTQLVFTDSGITMQDANNCKVETSDEGVVINGKLKVTV